ncbi:MAG: Rrf2 family transcriptional regulator [Planctomycetes bacterium]|nr:Rrf2 family transcriptional regulator [Planctomycetota bacterium]
MASRGVISEAASLGLHTMAILASQPAERWTNQALADCIRASNHHLAKVMQRLSRAGLVHAAVGVKGGFTLGRPAADIRLLEIYEVVDGPLDSESCLLREPLCDGERCVLGEAVLDIQRRLRDCLAKTTLAELARGVAVRRVEVAAKEPAGALLGDFI